MKYSAGMMSVPFLLIESCKTAQLFVEGRSAADAKRTVLQKNLYQMQSAYRSERYFNVINRRLSSLPISLLPEISQGDVAMAKLLLVIAIMRTDLLFFEFMHEVFRLALNMGNAKLETKDINLFFDQKASQSDIIAGWSETTVRHLKQSYTRVLFEAGLIDGIKEPRAIIRAYLSESVISSLKDAGLTSYLACILGDAYVS